MKHSTHHHRKKSKYKLPKITGYRFKGNRGCSQDARQRPNWAGWLQGEYVKGHVHCVTRAVLTHDVMYPEFFLFGNLPRQPYIQM